MNVSVIVSCCLRFGAAATLYKNFGQLVNHLCSRQPRPAALLVMYMLEELFMALTGAVPAVLQQCPLSAASLTNPADAFTCDYPGHPTWLVMCYCGSALKVQLGLGSWTSLQWLARQYTVCAIAAVSLTMATCWCSLACTYRH